MISLLRQVLVSEADNPAAEACYSIQWNAMSVWYSQYFSKLSIRKKKRKTSTVSWIRTNDLPILERVYQGKRATLKERGLPGSGVLTTAPPRLFLLVIGDMEKVVYKGLVLRVGCCGKEKVV